MNGGVHDLLLGRLDLLGGLPALGDSDPIREREHFRQIRARITATTAEPASADAPHGSLFGATLRAPPHGALPDLKTGASRALALDGPLATIVSSLATGFLFGGAR
ncbi:MULTISPECIES: hypothetical protein [unclassified Bradyrhizobium]|uniref:hypothetical protein n=1 Tax=unclassified Bradyrhizobium TaxID=2631580 RepID=UPI0015A61CFF|nr:MULTISPECIES: hypothetical protein [unclassified Bradyrhizobium]MBB4380781.1 hypothetical protein [Bradyrhizobium sp. SBR1B]